MNDALKSLLDLQKVDADLHFLRELKAKRPLELQKERALLDRARESVAAIADGVKQIKMECDRCELEIKQKQADIEKLQVALNTSRTNQEYQVFKEQIERATRESGELEEAVLERFNKIDALNAERAGVEEGVKEAQREYDAKEGEMNRFLGEVDEKIAVLDKQRSEMTTQIPREALELYDRVLSRYEDSALALVDRHDKICQGCFMTVTSQAINLLMQGEEIIQCKSCLRILYLPPTGS